MRTYSGRKVMGGKGAPSLKDIAIMQGRICRYNGACSIFWPVLVHSLAVADFLDTPEQKLHGLLHDAAEIIISDIPCTIKTKKQDKLEMVYLRNIYKELNIPWPSLKLSQEVKQADHEIGKAECLIFGPKNIIKDYNGNISTTARAVSIVNHYAKHITLEDVLYPDGAYVTDFLDYYESAYDEASSEWKSKKHRNKWLTLDTIKAKIHLQR